MTAAVQKNRRAVVVGLFILLGIVILVVTVFTLGSQQKSFGNAINITAVFDDVGGLQKGNNIWFSGVKIGTVRSLEFYGKSQVRVVMHIDKKVQEYIRKDSKARISSEGFIGNKLIVIYGGTDAAGQVEDKSSIIVEKAISTDDMIATLQRNNENLVAITADFRMVSERLAAGQGTLGALLKDESIYRSLENTALAFRAVVRNAEKTSSSISEYASQLQTPGSLADGLVHDTVIMSRLKGTADQLQLASQTAVAFSDNLKDASSRLNDPNNSLGLLMSDANTANKLRSIIDNINSSTHKLDENMEALQHNFLLRGYFRKKEKREKELQTSSARQE